MKIPNGEHRFENCSVLGLDVKFLKGQSQEVTKRNFNKTRCMLRLSIAALLLMVIAAAVTVARHAAVYFPIESSLPKSQVHSVIQGSGAHFSPANNSVYKLEPEQVISCYYNTPSDYESHQLLPSDVHPNLCTHINIAFAQIINKEISLSDIQKRAVKEIVKLKSINPKLKILLSVGGAGNDNGFSEMVVNHASRKIFIKSIKYILRNFTLDGVDLDWEFPAIHNSNEVGDGRERQHFSQLLREIKAEYIREKRNYLLTVAVPAPQTIVDVSYDIDQLNMYADYVNIMTYDFHYFTRFTPFTGLNSPLYARPTEELYLATLNINYTVHMYIEKGLNRNKIVVGIPTYGHSFTLVNRNNAGIGSPASGYGVLGNLGFVNYPDICQFLKTHSNDTDVVKDKDARVPYLFRDQEWVSYDSPESVIAKAKYIKDNKLRGAMIYCLNADDYAGVCADSLGADDEFPLSRSVKSALFDQGDVTASDEMEK